MARKQQKSVSPSGISRRSLLTAGLVTTAWWLFPHRAAAAARKTFFPERKLFLHNIHTGESMKTLYWNEGTYVPEALEEINYLLRDYRTGEVKEIDTDLLDLLFALRRRLGSKGPFEVISGYRSAATNALLRSKNKGVAKHSLHIQGKAIDIRLPGYDLKNVKRAAVALRRGGVGYYPASDFVHVDIGRLRYW